MTENTILKKRGRKSKKDLAEIAKSKLVEVEVPSDEEKIILHLPIKINTLDTNINELFIQTDKNVSITSEYEENISTDLIDSIYNTNINKIIVNTIKYDSHVKCWWCKNTFETPTVQLPETYFNNIFYCIGHFCSFNCAKSYNIDLHDFSIYKRNTLLNLLYYSIYSQYINITPAPHWLLLEDYGGILCINKFRENSIVNIKEYLLLQPPIISRQMQIEESYKINKLKQVSINNINKMYSDIDSNYLIKRNKPLSFNQIILKSSGIITTLKNNN